MPSSSPREHGAVFDEIAAAYDRNRPTYPERLVDHACATAGLAGGDRVLEIGCGSGQLTRDLAARGLRVTVVEPGRHLLSLAARNVAGPGSAPVTFVKARFEDAQLAGEPYRAVFAASSFQWLDPDVSWRKAADALPVGGTLALLQYCGLDEERSAHDQAALLAALARTVPEIAARWPSYRDLAGTVAGAERRRDNVSEVWAWLGSHDVARAQAGELFGDVRIATQPVLLEQTADELNALLRTHSSYRQISPDQREALERESAALYERLGRPIRSSTVAVLVTARRSG